MPALLTEPYSTDPLCYYYRVVSLVFGLDCSLIFKGDSPIAAGRRGRKSPHPLKRRYGLRQNDLPISGQCLPHSLHPTASQPSEKQHLAWCRSDLWDHTKPSPLPHSNFSPPMHLLSLPSPNNFSFRWPELNTRIQSELNQTTENAFQISINSSQLLHFRQNTDRQGSACGMTDGLLFKLMLQRCFAAILFEFKYKL